MRVEIEGVVNSDVMQRGERAVVEWTPRLVNLRRHGLIQVVDWYADVKAPVEEEPIVEGAGPEFVEEAHRIIVADEPDPDAEPEAFEAEEVLEEPPRGGRGASLQVWRDFVSKVGLPVYDDDDRNDLQDRYDEFRGR